MARIAITGNTYPVRDRLKALGANWNPDAKAWMVDAAKAGEAQRIVAGASFSSSSQKTRTARRTYATCHECGAPSKGYYRCYECSLEYRDGGGMHAGGMSYWDSNGNFVLGDDD